MQCVRRHLANAAFFLLLVAIVSARPHGDEEEGGMGMNMNMNTSQESQGGMNMDALPGTNADLLMADGSPMRPSYFRHKHYSSLMYAHIGLMVLAWIIFLPIAVVLSIARSKLKIPAQITFLLVNAFGILLSIIYNGETPDFYPGNSHHPLGWAITWIAVAWVLMGVVALYTQKRKDTGTGAQSRPLLRPITHQNMAAYQQIDNERWSGDSGQGTERNTESLCASSRSQSFNSELGEFPQHKKEEYKDEEDDDADLDPLHNDDDSRHVKAVGGFFHSFASRLGGRSLAVFNITHVVLERAILILGFVGFCTGGAVYGGIFRDRFIFSGLAHWIKGGIFVWYGLFAFGRWMGCFAEWGWAWNRRPSSRVYSCEWAESFLIFFYGASNVWLEHLANWGGEWSAIDFQHLSITIMFFGGGLLGMLIESSRVRDLLNINAQNSDHEDKDETDIPDHYGISLNPVPAIVILLLGIMMSSHTQHNMVASMVHKQWGMLFLAGSLARGVTYLTMWLKPARSHLPSRPPSEVVASFCMVSGGAIFMASSENTTDVLVQNHLGAMFVFTVLMGFTCLILAWEVCVFAIKGWAVERVHRAPSSKRSNMTTAA